MGIFYYFFVYGWIRSTSFNVNTFSRARGVDLNRFPLYLRIIYSRNFFVGIHSQPSKTAFVHWVYFCNSCQRLCNKPIQSFYLLFKLLLYYTFARSGFLFVFDFMFLFSSLDMFRCNVNMICFSPRTCISSLWLLW